MPWATKIKYKFIVDGRWVCQPGAPTETDLGGFVNNVYFTPPRPIAAPQPIGEILEKASSYPSFVPTPASEQKDASSQTEEATKEQESTTTENKAGEPSVAASPEGVRLPIPIIPVNAAEHNTILSTPPLPPVPDYVLPPSPRARSTSPSAEGRRPYPAPAPAPAVQEEVPEPEQTRLPIPIIPVNAAEHNTILTTPPQPSVPDYVLPPSPRARSTSPSSGERRPYPTAATPLPEPEPFKLHEVEVTPESSAAVAVAPEVPVEEKKQEAEATIPVDCAAPAHLSPKPEEPVASLEEEKIVVPEIPAAKPEEKEEKAHEKEASTPAPSALPTPPATPNTKDAASFPTLSQSPSPTASPSSSRFGTGKSRKKRQSIFGKIKDIFSSDKDKEKKGKSPLKT